MLQDLKNLSADLERLHQSGQVRPEGENFMGAIRVNVSQLIDRADADAQAKAMVLPDPVDVRLSELADKVGALTLQFWNVADLVSQLAKLAGDLQAATVRAAQVPDLAPATVPAAVEPTPAAATSTEGA